MNCDPNTLAGKAACFSSCVPGASVAAVRSYLLCKLAVAGISGNLIPPGSVYNGTSEFDIVILPNTTYTITWGANDVSATICGMQFASGGVGSQTTFASGNCTLVQLFGNAAGTTVTANIRKSNMVSTPGGTLLADGNGNVTLTISSWPTGPTAPTFVELWTSTDNVNFTLAGTVNNPTLTLSISPPAIGSFFYAKWRGANSGGFATFTNSKLFSGQMCDWVKRVNTNGGGIPGASTQLQTSIFDQTLVNNSLAAKMFYVLLMAPDSLIAAITPFYKVSGNDPATNTNFVAGDLSVNGLQGSGTKHLDTGFIDTSQIPAAGSPGGLTVMVTDGVKSDSTGLTGECNITGGSGFSLAWTSSAGGLSCFFYDNTAGNGLLAGTVPISCLISVNRTSATAGAIYAGDSTNGFRTITSSGSTNTAAPNGRTLAMMGFNFNGTFSGATSRVSFSAAHSGLTSGQAQTLYNAAQTLRTGYGGGGV